MDIAHGTGWRPRTTILLIVGLITVLIGLVAAFIAVNFKPTTQVHLGSGVFSLWLADTDAERVQGLSDVASLPKNGGLLMKFDSSAPHGIWMKDMNFPLDIIWLDEQKKVIYTVLNAQPEEVAATVYAPKEPALYVIELPMGSVKKSGIKTGDTAEFRIDV
jgi:uncharacterized membrane protein (UPF0127 family)